MFKLVDYDGSGSDEEKGESHDDQSDTFDCDINLPRVDVPEAKRFPREPIASSRPVSLHATLATSQERANKLHTISTEPLPTEPEFDSSSTNKSGLLALLPKPKACLSVSRAMQTKLIPSNIRPTITPRPNQSKPVQKRPVAESTDDNDLDNDECDIFGLDLKMPRVDAAETDRLSCETTISATTTVFYDADVEPVGPSRPVSLQAPQEEQANRLHTISNEMASKLIYEKDLAGFGISEIAASRLVNDIVDVSVDRALGPNIHQTLLKNLNTKVMAQVATGPLPQIKKDSKDKMAKRKHQITHLAALAVSREEELQDKWAESRARKKASSQKYGF